MRYVSTVLSPSSCPAPLGRVALRQCVATKACAGRLPRQSYSRADAVTADSRALHMGCSATKLTTWSRWSVLQSRFQSTTVGRSQSQAHPPTNARGSQIPPATSPSLTSPSTMMHVAKGQSPDKSPGRPHSVARDITPLLADIRFDRPMHHLGMVAPLNLQGIARDYLHPLQTLALRRVSEWDGQSFAWSVRVSVSVSAKAVVRNFVARRVKRAVREELATRGWGVNGEVLRADGTAKRPLQGALMITADKRLVTAEYDDVKLGVAAVIDKIVARQKTASTDRRHGNGKGMNGQPHKQFPRSQRDGTVRKGDDAGMNTAIASQSEASHGSNRASGGAFRRLAMFERR